MNNYYSQNKKIVNSPFLVKGILNDTIIYDSIYSLKHFEPVFDLNGKIKTIGSGSYGQVYLGLNTITNEYYAIKHMDKKNTQNLLHSLTAVQKEIEIQSKIEHPNIVKLLYVKETDISYDLIMEYAKGGNLFHFIRKTKGLSEDLSFSLFIQVVNAINFLHENDLIHRDIQPENILMFENNIVKLCDFGWCVKLNGQQR
jgi:5'-AMP-activated protein kinase catalytic alpha subunit